MRHLLDDRQLDLARRALLASDSQLLLDFMFKLSLSQPAQASPSVLGLSRDLGWVESGSTRLTTLGWLVGDVVREYQFWIERGRKTHGEDDHPLLAAERYEGKTVLEPGSGFGCNLLSLSRRPGRFVGVEPVGLYRQLTPIFAEREGVPEPLVFEGSGESLPFSDDEFDVVLCYSSHQYMDIRLALREMARVLRPGGQLQIIGGTLDAYARNMGRRVFEGRELKPALKYALTVANTLGYEYLGRRFVIPRGAAATTAPVYPRGPFIWKWVREVGLAPRPDLLRRFSGETAFFADKPGR